LKLLIQRVSKASVEVENQIIASINEGVLVFVGFDKEDNFEKIKPLADKLLEYKIFNDSHNKIALSLHETNNDILIVPQVTLSVGTKKGTKPSFSKAADPQKGNQLFEDFKKLLSTKFKPIKSGVFGSEMSVSLINEGPITFWFEL
tara:strand:- start:7420 stop:7857 length:438 start_codon:yes stop_codon:yes gene_type:complete